MAKEPAKKAAPKTQTEADMAEENTSSNTGPLVLDARCYDL